MSGFRFQEQKAVSLRHRIADEIRVAIFGGKLKPGDRLLELDISKQMGVSRGPIREAFRVLELEGLIISQPFRETVVADLSKDEVIEVLLPIRLTLELYTLRKVLPLVDESDLVALQNLINEMQKSGAKRDIAKVVEYDLAFHEYMIIKSQVPHVMNMWSSISNRIRLHFLFQGQQYEDITRVWEYHEPLLHAVAGREVENVCSAFSDHIYDSNLRSLGIIKNV